MARYGRGLYEQLLTESLAEKLLEAREGVEPIYEPLEAADASDHLAFHLGEVIERVIDSVPESERVQRGVELARRLIDVLGEELKEPGFAPHRPMAPGRMLRAVASLRPDGSREEIPDPLLSLLDTALLTNAPREPRVGSQILAELPSVDSIDVVMAFIRQSGIRPFLRQLERHCAEGKKLRVLTTTYTGSTEPRALETLEKIGAEVRVSYDIGSTRLHAKAWLLHRESGASTAYIGSSNLTHTAQTNGLEWNVRVSGRRNPSVVEKVRAVFDTYWNAPDFKPFVLSEFEEAIARTSPENDGVLLSPIEVRPEPFQERLLEAISVSRSQGHHRNLLVAATGTGKTVMAALDYARLRDSLPRARLLFVAHVEEILQQSLSTFRHVLRSPSFGELWVGGKRPRDFEHVFASIQSLRASGYENLAPDAFDIVIVDEFHHAAASSYEALLSHVKPVELLGLTATPERSDGLSVLEYFDGRIAAEIRLWDAIDQHRLVPFEYYGVHDGLDLRQLPWKRGRGYDVEALSNVLTSNDAWARLVVQEVARHVDDVHEMQALGFCVSIAHARYMARIFEAAGVRAVAVWADTPALERQGALDRLAAGELNIVFSVDLFNEGVNVPAVDTLVMLRPTDSPTLFLQQLGRGLRRHPDKTRCTVIDFVGHHRKEYRLDRRYRALLGGTRGELTKQIESGFPFLPAGCHMELEGLAKDVVLANLRSAISANWTAKVDELRAFAAASPTVTLRGFLDDAGLELEDVYTGNKSWSDLREAAGLSNAIVGPNEVALRRGVGRLLHVDDEFRLREFSRLLQSPDSPRADALTERDRRYLRMLVAQVLDKAVTKNTSLQEAAELLWRHPQIRAELLELFAALEERRTHLTHALVGMPDVPLRVHAQYTRLEILAALGAGSGAKVAPWQTGVMWLEQAQADLLAVTLDKTSGQFSPRTRYRDYAISRELIHWESQSVTRAESGTGQRYRNHVARGSRILMFVRGNTEERAFYFLGSARYVAHEGEMPMAITWKLDIPLPADLFTEFAAAVA